MLSGSASKGWIEQRIEHLAKNIEQMKRWAKEGK
jgi:hypothetical protein